jgi:diguanylate cyclase (GGDEF)-like protein
VARNKAGKAVAVVSGGLDLSDFIRSVVNSELPGAISILLDRNGAIQGHPDASMIDFASSRKAAGKEAQHTLVALLDNPDDGVLLNKAMAALVDGKSEVETLDLMVQGKRQLVGLTWLPQIQWFVVTMTSPANAVADTDLAWAAIWLAVALNLVLLVVMFILQKTVVSRVIRLDEAAKTISEGARRVEIPADSSDDEIGHLTRTFKTMVDRIAIHTEELEGLVAERTEKFERLAQTDFLTGVMNRRGMMVRLEAERSRLLRTGGWMAVIIIDIDHFKRINDTCGHAIGDQALIAAAKVLKDSVREYDLVARWGGEEFLIALFGLTQFDELQVVAEKLLAAIRKDSLDCGETAIKLTYSIGGVMADPMANLDAIIHQADEALYRAKIEGRDRAVLDCLLLGESRCDLPICCGDDKTCPVAVDGQVS